MKELNLDEQKQILLVVLKEIDAFCNKANILQVEYPSGWGRGEYPRLKRRVSAPWSG